MHVRRGRDLRFHGAEPVILAAVGLAVLSAQSAPPRVAQARPPANGPLKVGETVQVYSLFGWVKVQITAMQGTALRVCCVDGQTLNVQVRNLRKVPGTNTPARFAPDPKPDVGCAGKIEGTYRDEVGVLSITFVPCKAKVTGSFFALRATRTIRN